MQEIKRIFPDGTELTDRLVGLESDELRRKFTVRRNELEQQLESGEVAKAEIREARRIGRNDPCPCGSGRKFKKCCGVNFASNDKRLG